MTRTLRHKLLPILMALLLLALDAGLRLPEAGAARFLTPLTVGEPVPDRSGPQMAEESILWSVAVRGGVPPFRYRFLLRTAGEAGPQAAAETSAPSWAWQPDRAGVYRVRVEVEDDRGMIAESSWSAPYDIIPRLKVAVPSSRLSPPIMSRMPVTWSTAAEGGMPPYSFAFQWRDSETGESVDAEVDGPEWTWVPDRAGRYQVRALVRDSLGNRTGSSWSSEWVVNPIFQVIEIVPDRYQAVADRHAPVTWKAHVEGGSGEYRYRFALYRDDRLVDEVDNGPVPSWVVSGWVTGEYRVRVVVTDGFENSVEGWSEPFRVGLNRVLVLPPHNLSGAVIPEQQIRDVLEMRLRDAGYDIPPADEQQRFMVEQRWRHTGYLPPRMAEALRRKLAVDAVLLTEILDYRDDAFPRLALVSRLVGTGPDLPVLWAGGDSRHGEADPGFLGLQKVRSVDVLLAGILAGTVDDLAAGMTEESLLVRSAMTAIPGFDETLRVQEERPLTIALFPFGNHTELERGGEILSAQVLLNLARRPGIRVLEPGLVRARLLEYRIIAPDGPSDADLVLLARSLDADYLLVGSLTRNFQAMTDPVRQPPESGLFLKVISLPERKLVDQFARFGRGDQGVYFYDYRRSWTTFELTDKLLSGAINTWLHNGTREPGFASPDI